jgi:hypothetical protein
MHPFKQKSQMSAAEFKAALREAGELSWRLGDEVDQAAL